MAGKGDHAPRPLSRRLMWFVGLWLAGIGTVAAVAALLKLVVGAATP